MSKPITLQVSGGTVGAPVHVLIGDRLVLVYDGGMVEDMASLRAEVDAARASRVAIETMGRMLQEIRDGVRPDGQGASEQRRREAWAAGFEAALVREDAGRAHAHDPGYRMPPEWGERKSAMAHEHGWRVGDMIRRVVAIAAGAPVDAPDPKAAPDALAQVLLWVRRMGCTCEEQREPDAALTDHDDTCAGHVEALIRGEVRR